MDTLEEYLDYLKSKRLEVNSIDSLESLTLPLSGTKVKKGDFIYSTRGKKEVFKVVDCVAINLNNPDIRNIEPFFLVKKLNDDKVYRARIMDVNSVNARVTGLRDAIKDLIKEVSSFEEAIEKFDD